MHNGIGHSSTIRGWLEAGGYRLPLAQAGPGFCIVRRSISLPPTEAELVIEIDGTEHREQVFLTAGISDFVAITKFAAR